MGLSVTNARRIGSSGLFRLSIRPGYQLIVISLGKLTPVKGAASFVLKAGFFGRWEGYQGFTLLAATRLRILFAPAPPRSQDSALAPRRKPVPLNPRRETSMSSQLSPRWSATSRCRQCRTCEPRRAKIRPLLWRAAETLTIRPAPSPPDC